MELEEKLYDLIKKDDSKETFLKNIDLFKEFYKDRHLYFLTKFNDEKVFEIFKFMLKNESGEIFEYFHAEILKNIKFSFDKIEYIYHAKDKKITEYDIDYIFEMISRYQEINNLIRKEEYQNKLDDYNKSMINTFNEDLFMRDMVTSLILILEKGIFTIPSEKIIKTIDYLNNSSWIKEATNLNQYHDMLTRDFVYQYITKYLSVKDFSIPEDNQDNLLKNIFTGQVQDEKLIKQIIKEADLNYIYESIYDQKIENLVNFLETNNYDEVTNQIIFNAFATNLLKEEVPIDIYHNKSIYIERFFNDTEKEKNKCNLLEQEPFKENQEMIQYFLENNIYSYNFLLNLATAITREEYDEETKRKIKSAYKEFFEEEISDFSISNEEIIKRFNQMIENNHYHKIEINLLIRALIKNLNPTVSLYIGKTEQRGGYFYHENKSILINEFLIDQFIDKKGIERFELFEAVFHELTHAKQYEDLENQNYNEENIKILIERIIREHYPNYYEKNYLSISYEYDARINSYQLTKDFICQNFKVSALEANQYYDKKVKEEEKYNNTTRIAFSTNLDLAEMIDKLVSLKPMILEEYPILKDYLNQSNAKGILK